ncbi:MAG: magnesium transporter [Myxococcales bacterium]|jgi:magnesium transporter
MRVSELVLPEVRDALKGDPAAIRELVDELHPADSADIFISLEEDERFQFLKALPIAAQVGILEELDDELRAETFEKIAPEIATRLAVEMSPDERADLFRALPPTFAAKLLARLPKEDVKDLRSLLAWPEGTAGALMTTGFVDLDAEMTVAQAIDRIREVAEEVETIYYAYAVSPEGSLRGVVSLRSLVTAKPQTKLAEIMDTEHLIAVKGDTDQEEVAQIISKYDLLAVPVVDDAGRILGIVTVDDVVDVVEEETTEDVQKLSGMAPLEESYFRASFFRMVRSRAGWLIVLFIGELLTGTALRAYEESIAGALALVFFIPLIVSAGGNTGSQSAGLLIRALAIGEVIPKQAWRVAVREAATGLILGAILALIGSARALLWPGVGAEVALVVGLAVLFIVCFGAVVGALMPLFIKSMGLDPAVSSSPLIATLVDVTGMVIYFQIARAVLGTG